MATITQLPIESQPPFYEAVKQHVPTRITEAIGRIAGTQVELHCTIEQPADDMLVIDQRPILVAHGYFGAEETYDDYRNQLAQRGRTAVTWEPARSKGLWTDISLRDIWRPEKIACQTALGVTRAVNEETGQTEFDGSGHSNGLQTLTKLAGHRPELFRSIVALGGVGLDHHTLLQMGGRVGKFALKDLLRPKFLSIMAEPDIILGEAKYFAANPLLTGAEAVSAGTCNLHKQLRLLRNRHNILLGAIQYQQDDFFPLKDVKEDAEHLFDEFHIYRDPSMRHTGPQEDPSGSAQATIEVIENLLAKRAKPFEPDSIAA